MSYEYMTGFGQDDDAANRGAPAPEETEIYKRWKALREGRIGNFGISTAIQGDPCSPPDDGIVRQWYAPIPSNRLAEMKQNDRYKSLKQLGCFITPRFFDIENLELCCPPGAILPSYVTALPGTKEPPPNGNGVTPPNGNGVTPPNGNGVTPPNGNGVVTNGALVNGNDVVVAEETKYFGLTPMQLGMVVAGGAALYFLVIKK